MRSRHPARPVAPGTVYLVGAGPGDPSLLTLRAFDVLQHADVVLHDHLVSADVLAECQPCARLINVGKIGHGPQVEQSTIEGQLIAFARSGQGVVRLKGGDPFVFGRGSEEACALRRAHVPFEVVPGISSAMAAPAYAGIPLTARGLSASIAIVTGHSAQSDEPAPIPQADTIVVLMGLANARAVRDQLLAAGRRGGTPAAAIEWGTHARQRAVTATLATLPDVIACAGISAPAVIVIGETVKLRAMLEWFEPAMDESLVRSRRVRV
jgi:uroporphyrin-III C-methyltransferase